MTLWRTVAKLWCHKLCAIFWTTLYILEKFWLYLTHSPRSPHWMDLHEILHKGLSRRRNHLFQISCRSVEGFRICAGSNFAILHWLSWSPLTQGCATVVCVTVSVSLTAMLSVSEVIHSMLVLSSVVLLMSTPSTWLSVLCFYLLIGLYVKGSLHSCWQ